jgi:hypothetical protein
LRQLCIFWKRYKKPVIIAKTLTRGPARATISSSAGSSGSLSNRAKPPMGSNVMSLVCIP